MSKGLRTAAMVIGGVALVASGLGAAAGAGLIGTGVGASATVLGVSAGTLSAIGAIGGLAAAALTTLAGAPKQTYAGQVTQFKIDPNSPIPYAMGRIYTGGTIVHRDTYGTDNQYFGHIVVLSGGGPIQAIESFYIDRKVVTFSGSNANGTYKDYLHLQKQLGATPEATQLSMSEMPNWGASHKLSGYAAIAPRWRFDKNGKKWTNGIPEAGAVLLGAKVYDARQDSTYPGGSGPCRAGDESTYVGGAAAQNPWCHALTYALGRFQNGKRVVGIGMAMALINVASFVEAANVADVNGWTIGGLVSSYDTKWTNLKLIAQAGGGKIIPAGGRVSAMVNAPRTALATITADDLAEGDTSVPAMTSGRDKPNIAIPKFRSEAHLWEIIPAAAVSIAGYIEADGGPITKEFEFPLVTGLNQAATFAAYEIYNARETLPIRLPLKPAWVGYRVGDCLRLHLPGADHGLVNQDAIVVAKTFDPETSVVTMTFQTETAAKHADALGRTGAAPVAPTLSDDDPSQVAAPAIGTWTAVGATLTDNGVSIPALVLTGAVSNGNASAIVVDYRVHNPANGAEDSWISTGTHETTLTKLEITSVTPETVYDVSVRYEVRSVVGERLIIDTVPSGEFRPGPVDWSEVVDDDGTKPDDNATVGAPAGTDVAGKPAEELILELGQARDDVDAAVARLNTQDRVNAVVDASQRQAEAGAGTVAEALLRALAQLNAQQEVVRDAGIYVDPTTGQVRIAGLERTAERVSSAEFRLNGVDATLQLKASVNYVDQAIAAAVLDPSQIADLEQVFVRVTAAELAIDGLNATVLLKADATTVTALGGMVVTVSQGLDALAGVVATKASSTALTEIDTRVTSVEQTITGLGDVAGIRTEIRQARYRNDQADEAMLRALSEADRAKRGVLEQIALVQQELSTRIVDGDHAEAMQRLLLTARQTATEAALAIEQFARAAADSAQVQSLNALTASLNGLSTSLSGQITRLDLVELSLAGKAAASSVETLSARVDGAEANIASVSEVAAGADGIARSIHGVLLDVNDYISGTVSENDGVRARFAILTDVFEIVAPGGGERFEYSDGAVRIYDASDNWIVKLGKLTA